MSDEKKPVRCGCGGEAVIYVTHWWGKCYVCECDECGTASRPCNTEAEAIEAWNTAMGTNTRKLLEVLVHDAIDTNVGREERTAKVIKHHYEINPYQDSIYNCLGGTELLCESCKKKVIIGDEYCSHCGAKLDWSGHE